MPAPAVIPAPKAYSKIVAVKTLVVKLRSHTWKWQLCKATTRLLPGGSLYPGTT